MKHIETQEQDPTAKLSGFVKSFAGDETGSVAVEYAMVAAGIGVAVAAAVVILGQTVSEVFFDQINEAVAGT